MVGDKWRILIFFLGAPPLLRTPFIALERLLLPQANDEQGQGSERRRTQSSEEAEGRNPEEWRDKRQANFEG